MCVFCIKECECEMPSYVLHMLHGNFINKLKNDDLDTNEKINQFMLGILMPDSCNGNEKDIAHFYSSDSEKMVLRTPDLNSFVSKYGKHLSDPFVMGYLAHLWLDKAFFESFFTNYVEFQDDKGNITLNKDDIKQVYIVRENKIISTNDLFSETYLYGDYTQLNAALISGYKLRKPEKADFKNPIEEVELKNFTYILNKLEKYFLLSPKTLNLKIFSEDDLKDFILKQSYEFLEYYEKQKEKFGLSNDGIYIDTEEFKNINIKIQKNDSQNINTDNQIETDRIIENRNKEIEQMINNWNKKMDLNITELKSDQSESDKHKKKREHKEYKKQKKRKKQMGEFDSRSEQYYHIAWLQLCNEAKTTSAEDILFMDRLILRLRYIHNRKEKEKKKYFCGEKILLLSTFISTIFNIVRTLNINDIVNLIFNVICLVVSAFIVYYTSRLTIFSSKETWLRHMSFYSKITLEADSLFAGSGEYSGLEAMQKINLFKGKIVTYTNEDYQNFFINMSGTSMDETDDHKKSEGDKKTTLYKS